MKHVTGDDNLQVDENVDKATANWLNENYATQAKKRMSMAVFKEVDAAGVEEKARQRHAHPLHQCRRHLSQTHAIVQGPMLTAGVRHDPQS